MNNEYKYETKYWMQNKVSQYSCKKKSQVEDFLSRIHTL